MAGFFFAGGFVAWAWLFDRATTRWRAWLAGSALAALPLLPWLWHISHELGHGPAHAVRWTRWITGHYFSRWIANPLGLTLEFSLGEDFWDFLRCPLFAGRPTYVVAALHGVIVALALAVLWRAWLRWWRGPRPQLAVLIGRHSPTAFTLAAALWGYGSLLTATSLPVHRHYVIVLFSLGFVWWARVALGSASGFRHWGRGLLLGLCVSEALLSVAFLAYVHQNQRHIRGDYGIPYGAKFRSARMARH